MKLTKVQQEREAAWQQHIFGPVKPQKATKKVKQLTPAQAHKNYQRAVKRLEKAFGVK